MSDEQWGVGDASKATVFDKRQVMDDGSEFGVIYGEHPHSRNDNRLYARFPDGRIEDFDGHRVRTRVDLRTFNYLKCSGLSGNEVRKGGQFRIYLNDRLVWAEFCREADRALLNAHRRLGEIMEASYRLYGDDEPETGRAVFYHGHPCTVERWMCDENEGSGNRVVLRSAEGKFPPPVWHDPEEDGEYDEASDTLVTNTLDPAIWWWRK